MKKGYRCPAPWRQIWGQLWRAIQLKQFVDLAEVFPETALQPEVNWVFWTRGGGMLIYNICQFLCTPVLTYHLSQPNFSLSTFLLSFLVIYRWWCQDHVLNKLLDSNLCLSQSLLPRKTNLGTNGNSGKWLAARRENTLPLEKRAHCSSHKEPRSSQSCLELIS